MKRAYERLRQFVLALHARGLTKTEAAKAAGCSIGTVSGIWWKAGLRRKRPNLTPEELEQQHRDIQRANAQRFQGGEVWLRRKARQGKPAPPAKTIAHEARFLRPEDRRAGR